MAHNLFVLVDLLGTFAFVDPTNKNARRNLRFVLAPTITNKQSLNKKPDNQNLRILVHSTSEW